ncbi:Basic membrane protein A2 [Gluconacetobacter sp. SXCC-1]|uniref:BMP family protein n=1 Tax=Komagataeibacter rhaeticus TaxID=215221 RepID=UPI000208098D|nr:BMP family protein [Komagataeibacter rhaeticus]ATU72842.1 BMP family ABC transporter substrate-binding protein [Komagataeibacter xylinus]EGG76742.1 Basic membrane protein A2 [Gluconacetobacter sp. SXCC-1]WPP22625.1 BMP family protein [Komagataeibacter rhaeticus]SAY46822.1 Purine-binding protein precursor [Komagataeibacter rhaeticus]SAY50035.1 Purine-binding protein precursor [Komagataeibacter rhaeticus]
MSGFLSRRLFLGASVLSGLPGVARAAPARVFRVALVMTSSIADGGWNHLAFLGLRQARDDLGVHVAYAENVAQAEITEVTRGYADDGYDLILGHGFQFGSAFIEICQEYPHQQFFVTSYAPAGEAAANVRFIDLAYYDLAFDTGALAALISAGGGVAFIGGQDNPAQKRVMQTFQDGARAARPGMLATGIITGDYNNASRGREAVESLVAKGVDVIWHTSDVTGLGVLQGAQVAGIKAIGCYTDQSSMAPAAVATSTVLQLAWMVHTVIADTLAQAAPTGGEWKPALEQLWAYDWKGQMFNPALVSAPMQTGFATFRHDEHAGLYPRPAQGDTP